MNQSDLMDVIELIESECRSYKSASMMASAPAQRGHYAQCARREALVLRQVRHEMATARRSLAPRRINACINQLLDAQMDVYSERFV